MKKCVSCGLDKEDANFSLRGDTGKRRGQCEACIANKKSLRYFSDRKANCDRQKEIRAKDPEKHRRECLEWRKKNPEKAARLDWVKRLKRYGITIEDWDRMFIEQGGRCAICVEVSERLCVDHDHVTGTVRGLLCLTCNFAVGALKDSPLLAESLIRYLKKNLTKPVGVIP